MTTNLAPRTEAEWEGVMNTRTAVLMRKKVDDLKLLCVDRGLPDAGNKKECVALLASAEVKLERDNEAATLEQYRKEAAAFARVCNGEDSDLVSLVLLQLQPPPHHHNNSNYC